ncbi:regulatory-associated protein of TOR 1 isoform X4 [Capsicum annuum]|uniref:regulatory-associated protein of TOR 1 isoform X4 n=1 Tax=Capsicum annuum TaxID=4072 RepID=UPI001FB06684|nr:regulatory-associated protein of TOR 1 isoform X4 [Capsicum annuum]
MALGDLMVTSRSTAVVEEVADHENDDRINNRDSDVASSSHGAVADNGTMTVTTTTSYGYVPQYIFFRELRHEEFEEYVPSGQANSGVVSKWRTKERSASEVHVGQFGAGFVDGSVKLFDIRMPEMLVCSIRPHTEVERVVGVGFQPELQPAKVVSASQAGDIQFLDMRNLKEAYLSIYAHRGSLTSLALHRHAPLVASDSSKQLFKIFNLEGEQLGTIRYLSTFMVQRIGSVRCLTFHPYQVLLAAGAADACVSVYVDEVTSS